MFKPTSNQRSLLENEFLLPPAKAARLRKSWAEPFRGRILPVIDEESFHECFSDTTGRPNKSIRQLVGLHLLQHWHDLTDEQALDALEYNLQWHHALGVEAGDAHVCQKTLHNFRVRLLESDRACQAVCDITRKLAEADGLNLGLQRLDSTHVLSNIAVLTRLGLFVETVAHFLKELREEEPAAFASLNAEYGRRYLDREGYFSDAKREQARRRLPVVAQDVYALVGEFSGVEAVKALPAFKLLQRLFEEQCEVVEEEPGDDNNDGDDGGAGPAVGGKATRVKLREPKTIASNSLQSPYDPDATYGHKGKGYEVQLAETCDDNNPYQLITGVSVNGAHESDHKALVPMLDQLADAGMLPEQLLADTGYGSGTNIVESADRGVALLAPVQDPDAPERPEAFAAPVSEMPLMVPAREPGAITVTGEPPEPTLNPAEVIEPRPADTVVLPSSEAVPLAESPKAGSGQALGLESFQFNSTFRQLISCAAGNAPEYQHLADGQLIARFSGLHCSTCSLAGVCPLRLLAGGDRLLRRAPETIATEVRQYEQQQSPFKEQYRKRSGIESTNSEAKGRHGLGNLRVRGGPKVDLIAKLKVLAINTKRSVMYHVSELVAVPLTPCPT